VTTGGIRKRRLSKKPRKRTIHVTPNAKIRAPQTTSHYCKLADRKSKKKSGIETSKKIQKRGAPKKQRRPELSSASRPIAARNLRGGEERGEEVLLCVQCAEGISLERKGMGEKRGQRHPSRVCLSGKEEDKEGTSIEGKK